jgi:hypothetical protein
MAVPDRLPLQRALDEDSVDKGRVIGQDRVSGDPVPEGTTSEELRAALGTEEVVGTGGNGGSDEPSKDAPDPELDEGINAIARQVCDRGLSVPAVFFLEMNKPLTGILHASAMVAGPSLKLLFGQQRAGIVESLLSSRANIERLIQRIEAYEDR